MRLLFLTETIPYPLDSGGRIKTYNTLRMLSQEHEVHCHAFVREEQQLRFRPELAKVCADVTLHTVKRSRLTELGAGLSSLVTGVPFIVKRHFHPPVLGRLREACRTQVFDGVYCDHLSMLEYGRRLDLPIVLDAHNVEFEIIRRYAETLGASPLRLIAELEWRRLERYERRWYPACRLIFAVSEVDGRTIREFAGDQVPVIGVPISVDAHAVPHDRRAVNDPELLFVGGLHWPPNADAVSYFLADIFPAVQEAVPQARVTVVGKGAEALARRFGQNPGVRFAGHVEDVEQFFRSSRVMVVPIRSGSGMRVKILDALARQVPTVTTSIGCEGIEVVPGTHILVGDTPREFAGQVTRLLTDGELPRRLGAAGRDLVLKRYDFSVVAESALGPLRRSLVR
jgi:glycosyltransferase involved in cell wall biosynthesis